MKWTHKPAPKIGNRRHVRAFLWLPKRIGNETRWLEIATWTEHYKVFKGGDSWQALEWIS